jgi:citrate synthase
MPPSIVAPIETCTLRVDGIEAKIPILLGTDGNKMLDIQSLYSQAKIFNYDPGYSITGSCNSTISYATTDGRLYYRGYAIQDLVR